MVSSVLIPNPAEGVESLIAATKRYRCACCRGPALPVLEWRLPRGKQPGYYLCHRCAQFCKVMEKKGALQFEHVKALRLDWDMVDSKWAVDLGFKRLQTR